MEIAPPPHLYLRLKNSSSRFFVAVLAKTQNNQFPGSLDSHTLCYIVLPLEEKQQMKGQIPSLLQQRPGGGMQVRRQPPLERIICLQEQEGEAFGAGWEKTWKFPPCLYLSLPQLFT